MAANEIISAFQVIFTPLGIGLIVLSVLFGMFIGALPGLGNVVTLTLLLPLTYGMEPVLAFMIFAAALGGGNFGGSITAILINTPGTAPNAATLLDGYPMTKKGEGGRAIGASAIASGAGAIFGIIILALSIPFLRLIAVYFGPPEIFWLGIWGLTVVAVVVRGSIVTGLISALLGVIITLHGVNHVIGGYRWTYGQTFLLDGFGLVPPLLGLFAVAEMIKLVSKGGTIAEADPHIGGGKWVGVRDVIQNKWLFLRSSIIGAVIGAIPGIGGTAANYIAYFQAKQYSNDPDSFGTGNVQGVIASESANDAKDGTSLLPTLGLGVPGSASMAILLGAFILHGMTPGPLLIERHLDIVVIIVIALFMSNILTSTIGMLSAEKLVYVTRIDVRILAPVVLVVVFLGSYALGHNIFDVFVTLVFGLVGFVMITFNIERVPLVLALVLAPIVEQNYFRTLQLGRGDHLLFISSNVSKILIFLVIMSLLIPYLKQAFNLQTFSEEP